ncbi:SCO4225 family membrane protein [Actinocorallia sp. A-T 12471]|uniref:SCO4225 family membrane protein n=1 Tax=Actinocorallia sp. A-T 12471 TaxID=3089813 RepID=UPI0029D09EDC|nr:hypothetical protein [Actinocorallia sp. A-T 12471]MDX6739830.1 hypothetical protein [Actinocorallia sp. A-T 12471]
MEAPSTASRSVAGVIARAYLLLVLAAFAVGVVPYLLHGEGPEDALGFVWLVGATLPGCLAVLSALPSGHVILNAVALVATGALQSWLLHKLLRRLLPNP